MSSGKILIIDDEETFLQAYRDKLGSEGYVIETATTAAAALEKLDQPGWDVVLLDQKLQGPAGPDSGVDLVDEIARRAPATRILLVTGYATAKAIARAFDSGVHDYLQKDELFSALLAPKLRTAVEVARALRLASHTSEETEAEIRATWLAVSSETDPHRKGKQLEDLMVLLMKTIPGFRHTTPRRRNELEEIDVLVRNESSDPFWAREGAYILFECKNWSKPVGASELREFATKLERRYGRCRLGIFVAPGGFTEPLKLELLRRSKEEHLILLLGDTELRRWVESRDRGRFLKDLHERAVVETNGH